MVALASGDKVLVHSALFMIACDIPACRKVCGFAGPGARKGCNKCDNAWPARSDEPTQRDYSNFDTSTWIPRKKLTQRRLAHDWFNQATKTARTEFLSNHGVRWSEVWRLKYFDPIRCSVVDPMHNLYSGTASRMMRHWIEDMAVMKDSTTKQWQLSTLAKQALLQYASSVAQ